MIRVVHEAHSIEVKRLNFYHAKAMVELLMLSDSHHEEEVEDEEAEDVLVED